MDTATIKPLVTIETSPNRWVIRASGAILAESNSVLIIHEKGHDPVVYFPRADVASALLDESEKTTDCARKGTAQYYHIEMLNRQLPNAAWSYLDPAPNLKAMAGYLAFEQSDYLTIEEM